MRRIGQECRRRRNIGQIDKGNQKCYGRGNKEEKRSTKY